MKQDRKQRIRRGLKIGGALAVVGALAGGLAGWSLDRAGYTLTANLTPSVPVGLYLSDANQQGAERGKLVTFHPHNAAAQYAFQRGWMKPGSVYVKRVAAVAGDMVCADKELTIRTQSVGETSAFVRVGEIAETDHDGQPLPHLLSGCERVPEGYFLPVGDGLPNSYDGRYYGFVPVSAIVASLRPLWTKSEPKE
jgi:signal peptidase I